MKRHRAFSTHASNIEEGNGQYIAGETTPECRPTLTSLMPCSLQAERNSTEAHGMGADVARAKGAVKLAPASDDTDVQGAVGGGRRHKALEQGNRDRKQETRAVGARPENAAGPLRRL